MSIICLILSGLILLSLGYLTYYIRSQYRWSLTSVQEKSAGIIHFYRTQIGRVVRERDFAGPGIQCLIHYGLLHLVVLLHLDCNSRKARSSSS